jgi:hypothetical protein
MLFGQLVQGGAASIDVAEKSATGGKELVFRYEPSFPARIAVNAAGKAGNASPDRPGGSHKAAGQKRVREPVS